MTTQESFKRRIRARMAKTGERYGAARRALLEQAGAPARKADGCRRPRPARTRSRPPPVAAGTHGASSSTRTIGADADHATIARRLAEDHGIDSWWSQTVTVGYERIRGLRLPHQMADGTFTAGRSKTVTVDRDELRAALLDDAGRAVLFPAFPTELRSKPTSKTVRLAAGGGIVEIAMTPAAGDRTKVTVGHTKLASLDDVHVWKQFWGDWLDALDDTVPDDARPGNAS